MAEALDAGYWRDLANQCPRRARSIGKGTPCRLAVPPCLPTKAPQPPTGDAWLYRFRMVAREDGARVKLYSRPGRDLTYRFTLIIEALVRLRSRSCIIEGEAVCCGD